MEDNDLIPLSALQHYLYCPRQCALIHVERLWADNRYTAEGNLLHGKTDTAGVESRHGVRAVTAMPIINQTLGISGVADVVEFHASDGGDVAYPVEYKRGKPKDHRADEVQLCAQALCLEEMLHSQVNEGALYYGLIRHRLKVEFDLELRKLTLEVISKARALIASGKTPAASYDASVCRACSLSDLCQAKLLARRKSVRDWMRDELRE
jgi:CRISPR-associated exonuclease Cas4